MRDNRITPTWLQKAVPFGVNLHRDIARVVVNEQQAKRSRCLGDLIVQSLPLQLPPSSPITSLYLAQCRSISKIYCKRQLSWRHK